MELKELLKNIEAKNIVGDVKADITGVNIDSRRIQPGHLFVAIKGTQVDGHTFIGKALEQGAGRLNRGCCGACGHTFLWRPHIETETCGRDRYERQDYHCHLII